MSKGGYVNGKKLEELDDLMLYRYAHHFGNPYMNPLTHHLLETNRAETGYVFFLLSTNKKPGRKFQSELSPTN